MEKERFYDTLRPMECFAGDTLPTFEVMVNGVEDLTGYTMQLILTEERYPQTAALTKTCTASETETGVPYFAVRLTTTDTASLLGTYLLTFDMTDTAGAHYRKLAGALTVLPFGGGV